MRRSTSCRAIPFFHSAATPTVARNGFLLHQSSIRIPWKLTAFLVAALSLAATGASALAGSIVLTAVGSGGFTLPSVEWENVGTATVTTATIINNPVQGDFAFDMTVTGTIGSAGFLGAGRVFFLPITYNPATQGPISSIDWTIKQDAVNPFLAQSVDLMVRQGGNFYRTAGDRDQVDDGIFTDFSATGFTPVNFAHVGFDGNFLPGNPDFSAGGGIIEIGLSGNFSTGFDTQERMQEIQNFSVTIHTLSPPPSSVPEPSTFVLATLGLAGLSLVAWRRRRWRACRGRDAVGWLFGLKSGGTSIATVAGKGREKRATFCDRE